MFVLIIVELIMICTRCIDLFSFLILFGVTLFVNVYNYLKAKQAREAVRNSLNRIAESLKNLGTSDDE